MGKWTPRGAAKQIIEFRADGKSDKWIAKNHPELEVGFGLAHVKEKVAKKKSKPRGSGSSRLPTLPARL